MSAFQEAHLDISSLLYIPILKRPSHVGGSRHPERDNYISSKIQLARVCVVGL